MKNYEIIITSFQIGIWEAEYFIAQSIKVDFWTGKRSGLVSALYGLKSLGFDVSEVTKPLINPYT